MYDEQNEVLSFGRRKSQGNFWMTMSETKWSERRKKWRRENIKKEKQQKQQKREHQT